MLHLPIRHLAVVAGLVAGALSVTTRAAEAAAVPTPYYPVNDVGAHGTGAIDVPDAFSRVRVTAPNAQIVAFATAAALAADDTDSMVDIYQHDLWTDTYTRVSAPTDGTSANDGSSYRFDMSSDGRYVVFIGNSDHLPAAPGGVYVRDTLLGTTSTVHGGAGAVDVGMSLDGDYVAYSTFDSSAHVFVRQLSTGSETELAIPTLHNGALPGQFSLSVGGNRLAFSMSVTRTINGGSESNARVLVYDRSSSAFSYTPHIFGGPVPGSADLTSASAEPGPEAEGHGASEPSLSADGRYLAFSAEFDDLVENDTNGNGDVFFRDLEAPGLPLQLLSTTASGAHASGFAQAPMISADGRFVVFEGDDEAPAGYFGTACDCSHIVMWDRDALAGAKTTDASTDYDGVYRSSYPTQPALSVDGRFVTFATDSETATPDAEHDGGYYDLVMRDRSASYVDTNVAAGGIAQTQSTVDAANPFGMRATSPSGGHVLLTKSKKRVQPISFAIPLDVSFQAFLPTESAATPALVSLGVSDSVVPGSSGFERLTAVVDRAEVPPCVGNSLPASVTLCQKPMVDSAGVRQIDLLTTGVPGDEIDLAWAFGSPPPVIDTTAPTAVITTPPAAGSGIYALGSVVLAAYSCADEPGGSGLASCVGTVPAGSALPTSTPGVHQLTVDARDNAGHQTHVSATYTVLDQAVQSVTAGQVVTVSTGSTPSAADPVETAVTTSSAGAAGSVSVTEGPTTQGAPGQYTFLDYQVQIVAPDGNGTAPLTIAFALDQSILTAAGVDYLTVQVTRNGVPLGSCSVSAMPCVAQRQPLDAVTLAGARLTINTISASIWNFAKRAPFAFTAFAQPVDSPPTLNKVKAGSAVPVKFSLHGYQGMSVIADTYPRSAATSCSTSAPVDAIESTASPGAASMSYDAVSDLYTYVWKTDRGWTGCRQLVLRLADGAQRSALFQFTK